METIVLEGASLHTHRSILITRGARLFEKMKRYSFRKVVNLFIVRINIDCTFAYVAESIRRGLVY